MEKVVNSALTRLVESSRVYYSLNPAKVRVSQSANQIILLENHFEASKKGLLTQRVQRQSVLKVSLQLRLWWKASNVQTNTHTHIVNSNQVNTLYVRSTSQLLPFYSGTKCWSILINFFSGLETHWDIAHCILDCKSDGFYSWIFNLNFTPFPLSSFPIGGAVKSCPLSLHLNNTCIEWASECMDRWS